MKNKVKRSGESGDGEYSDGALLAETKGESGE